MTKNLNSPWTQMCDRCKRWDWNPPPLRPLGRKGPQGPQVRWVCNGCFEPSKAEGWMELPPDPFFANPDLLKVAAQVHRQYHLSTTDPKRSLPAAFKRLGDELSRSGLPAAARVEEASTT